MRMKTNETAVEALQNNPEPSLGGSSWIGQYAQPSPAFGGCTGCPDRRSRM